MSSRTSSFVSICRSRPSRTTVPLGSVSSVSLSRVALLRSSCTMPMTILANTTPRNIASCHWPTAITHAASRKKSMLKYVSTLERMICPTVLPGGSMGRLSQPARARSSACLVLRPVSASASNTGTLRLKSVSISLFFRIRLIIDILAHPQRNYSEQCVNNCVNFAFSGPFRRPVSACGRRRQSAGAKDIGPGQNPGPISRINIAYQVPKLTSSG